MRAACCFFGRGGGKGVLAMKTCCGGTSFVRRFFGEGVLPWKLEQATTARTLTMRDVEWTYSSPCWNSSGTLKCIRKCIFFAWPLAVFFVGVVVGRRVAPEISPP